MGNKTCNRCGKKGLGWDYKFYKQTKKWKLENHRKDGKWCNKPTEVFMMRTKYDMVLCKLCDNTNFGLCLKGELEEHIRVNHKDGKNISDLDTVMMAHPLTAPSILKFWKNDKHYYKYKHLDKG